MSFSFSLFRFWKIPRNGGCHRIPTKTVLSIGWWRWISTNEQGLSPQGLEIRNFAKKNTQKFSQKLKSFFFLSHKKKFEKIKIRFLLVVCCIPGKLFLTFQDIKNLCVNNSSRINPMNKQTVIALQKKCAVYFSYLQVVKSKKYKFFYSEFCPLFGFQSRFLTLEN